MFWDLFTVEIIIEMTIFLSSGKAVQFRKCKTWKSDIFGFEEPVFSDFDVFSENGQKSNIGQVTKDDSGPILAILGDLGVLARSPKG